MSWTDRGDHRLLEEVDTLRPLVLAARLRRVLEAQCDVQAAVSHAGDQLVGAPLNSSDLQRPERTTELCDRLRHEHSQDAREGADPEPLPLLGQRFFDLRLGELQLLAERLGVREQQLADRGQREAGPPSHDQSFAELSLQRSDLLRDGGLRERERSGGMRERSPLRDLAKDDQPSRIQHRNFLYHRKKDDCY